MSESNMSVLEDLADTDTDTGGKANSALDNLPTALAGKPRGEIFLGHNGTERLLLPMSSLLRHIACVGSTGSGKTWLVKRFCQEALLHGIPVIVIDPHGDLASMAQIPMTQQSSCTQSAAVGTDLLAEAVEPIVFTPASDAGIPICVSPLHVETYRGFDGNPRGQERYLHLVAELVTRQLPGLPKSKSVFFRSALAKCLRYGIAQGGTQHLDALSALLCAPPEALASEIHEVLSPRDVELLQRSFRVLLDSPARHLLDHGLPLDIDVLIGRSANPSGKTRLSIIYLNSLTSQEARLSFVALLAERLHQWMLSHPATDPAKPQLLFVIDEIGLFVPNPTQHKPICKDPLIALFKQARKYGLACLGAAQSPGDFDYRALGQANTMCIGRLKAEQDFCKVARLLGDGGFEGINQERIATLMPGEFVLWAPDAFAAPRRFQAAAPGFNNETITEAEIPQLIPANLRQRMMGSSNLRPQQLRAEPQLSGTAPLQGLLPGTAVQAHVKVSKIAQLPAEDSKPYSAPDPYDSSFEIPEIILSPRAPIMDKKAAHTRLSRGMSAWWSFKAASRIHSLEYSYLLLWQLTPVRPPRWWRFLFQAPAPQYVYLSATCPASVARLTRTRIEFVTTLQAKKTAARYPFEQLQWTCSDPDEALTQAVDHHRLRLEIPAVAAVAHSLGIPDAVLTLAALPCWVASIGNNNDGEYRTCAIEAVSGRELRLPDSAADPFYTSI